MLPNLVSESLEGLTARDEKGPLTRLRPQVYGMDHLVGFRIVYINSALGLIGHVDMVSASSDGDVSRTLVQLEGINSLQFGSRKYGEGG